MKIDEIKHKNICTTKYCASGTYSMMSEKISISPMVFCFSGKRGREKIANKFRELANVIESGNDVNTWYKEGNFED